MATYLNDKKKREMGGGASSESGSPESRIPESGYGMGGVRGGGRGGVRGDGVEGESSGIPDDRNRCLSSTVNIMAHSGPSMSSLAEVLTLITI